MGYFFGCGNACNQGGGGGGGTAGKYLQVALAAGVNNDFNPGSGWPTGYGRLDLVPAGDAVLNSLAAGLDGAEWQAYISATNTVTTQVCALVALTPTASVYNVRVFQ